MVATFVSNFNVNLISFNNGFTSGSGVLVVQPLKRLGGANIYTSVWGPLPTFNLAMKFLCKLRKDLLRGLDGKAMEFAIIPM